MSTITLDSGSASLPPADSLAGTNCGTPGVWRFDSGLPGPRIVITALMHGNEVCGAAALGPLVGTPPRPPRGSLTLVFCNLQAYARLTDANKDECRFVDEDMNRVWGRIDAPAQEDDTVEVRRAREVLRFVEGADVLLDLHSMTSPAPALGLVGLSPKNVALAQRIGHPALLVQDAGHASGLRLIDRGVYADPAAPQCAMLVECGQHFSRTAIDAAKESVRRTIAACLEGETLAPDAPQEVIRVTQAVTIQTDAFEWVQEFANMSVVPDAGTVVAHDGEREVRTPHDGAYMVMPASKRHRRTGLTAVRFARRVS